MFIFFSYCWVTWRPQKTSRVYYRETDRLQLCRIFAAALATAYTMIDDCLSVVYDYTNNKLQDRGHCSVSICTKTDKQSCNNLQRELLVGVFSKLKLKKTCGQSSSPRFVSTILQQNVFCSCFLFLLFTEVEKVLIVSALRNNCGVRLLSNL